MNGQYQPVRINPSMLQGHHDEFRELARQLKPDISQAELDQMEWRLVQAATDSQLLVAEELETRLYVGMVFITLSYSALYTTVHISDLVVHERHRRRGIANMLMRIIVKHARSKNFTSLHLFLEQTDDNLNALSKLLLHFKVEQGPGQIIIRP